MAGKKTVIVTGASQGIGAAVTRAFLDRGYNVVATSLKFSGPVRLHRWLGMPIELDVNAKFAEHANLMQSTSKSSSTFTFHDFPHLNYQQQE